MKLPSFKRLNTVDFKDEEKDFVGRISFPLNTGIENLYNLVDKNVSLSDNINCEVREILVTVDAAGKPIRPVSFSVRNNFRALGCQVILAQNSRSTSVFPTSSPFISFNQNSNIIDVLNVSGLQASQEYFIRVIVWGA